MNQAITLKTLLLFTLGLILLISVISFKTSPTVSKDTKVFISTDMNIIKSNIDNYSKLGYTLIGIESQSTTFVYDGYRNGYDSKIVNSPIMLIMEKIY